MQMAAEVVQWLESLATVAFPDLRIDFFTIAGAIAVVAAWCGQNLSLGSIVSPLSDYKLFLLQVSKEDYVLYR